MSAHTPGPWEVRFFRSKSHRIDAPGWNELAVVYGNEDDDLDRQGRANAHLIAAAPELLDFARQYLASGDWCVRQGETSEHCECEPCHLIRTARAVIAKAEGKS